MVDGRAKKEGSLVSRQEGPLAQGRGLRGHVADACNLRPSAAERQQCMYDKLFQLAQYVVETQFSPARPVGTYPQARWRRRSMNQTIEVMDYATRVREALLSLSQHPINRPPPSAAVAATDTAASAREGGSWSVTANKKASVVVRISFQNMQGGGGGSEGGLAISVVIEVLAIPAAVVAEG